MLVASVFVFLFLPAPTANVFPLETHNVFDVCLLVATGAYAVIVWILWRVFVNTNHHVIAVW